MATPDDAGKPRPGLLDLLIRVYQALTGRPDHPEIPPPPDPAEYERDMSPATPEERARAEAAAREAMRRLRSDE
jgi:hypothetical protein